MKINIHIHKKIIINFLMNRSTTLLKCLFSGTAHSKQPFGCSVKIRIKTTRSVTKERRCAKFAKSWSKLSAYMHLSPQTFK